VHSPFGAPVHAPWALAVAARLRERFGLDVQAMHADDGIVLRLPDTEFTDDAVPPQGDVGVFASDEIEALVTATVAELGVAGDGMKAMGRVMGVLTPQVRGRADGGAVAAEVRRQLGA